MFSMNVIFPDATALAIGHLNAVLSQPVSHTVPKSRPAEFVTVARTGGVASGAVDGAQLTFEIWAKTSAEAGALASLVRAHVTAMAGTTVNGTQIYRVEEAAGPQDFPDPASTQQRWTFTAIVHVRGGAFAPVVSA